MPYPQLDRTALRMKPLAERENKVHIERDRILPGEVPPVADRQLAGIVEEAADRIIRAGKAGRPVVLAFGAHTIKNGLGPVLISLVENGWLTHLA
ncbi:MAG: hypothetical protein JXQ83_12425, partial [Candidatus Glassbacteria bacterium]|nr:hypothetical protein [Candidatus Glassbacteria bacterium]